MEFTVPNLLKAVRGSTHFTREAIQESVIRSFYGVPRGFAGIGSAEDREREYKEILQKIGYDIVRYSASASPSCRMGIHTFETVLEPEKSADKRLLSLVERTKSILRRSGFGSVFYKVVLSDNIAEAVREYFPNVSPNEVISWGNLITQNALTPAYPQGILFSYEIEKGAHESFPCLILSPSNPREMTVEIFEILRVRIIHECTHFYLGHTCFSFDSSVSEATGVLETCGYLLGDVIRYLLEESFAHIDTAKFCSNEYFKIMDAGLAPTTNRIVHDELTSQFQRREVKIYMEVRQFIAQFPVLCACVQHGRFGQGKSISAQWTEELRTLGESLLIPIQKMYYHAALLPEAINTVKNVLLKPETLALFYTWKSIDELFNAKWEEWGL